MTTMPNVPQVKLAIVGVSRDCFPIELTRTRMKSLVKACKDAGLKVFACPTIIESESDAMKSLDEVRGAGCNAAVIYLGNFGPEGPISIFAKRFDGPVMVCAAAEDAGDKLIQGRGDAFCGLLSASYNLDLRNAAVHIPHAPVGLPEELAEKIVQFEVVARIVLGLKAVKVFAFGPRPQDFFACNAPLKPLYDLGVEVMENSELDMLQLYEGVKENDVQVKRTAQEMEAELGKGCAYPDLLPKLARFEVALRRFAEKNLGSKSFGIFANKCWPAFEKYFGFVPCYVNSRMSSKGYPVACEVDIYGAISEYLCQLATDSPATILDINNTVPADMLHRRMDLMGASPADLFMGFHCGNTPSCCMKNCSMKYQLIMNRLMEAGSKKPDITRGTLEGQLRPGPTTFFRLQSTADGELQSYIAEGNILDLDPKSFGGIGIFAIPNFARFYRYVLVEKQFPHHGAVAFRKCGKALFNALSLLGVWDISAPQPAGMLYPAENPFE